MDAGILYIVATPIGNLGDITFRAVEALQKADLVVCEDTRVTKKLLDRYGVMTPAASFYKFQKSKGSLKPEAKIEFLVEELKSGKNVALVTDAGTPGISDPGNRFVSEVLKNNIPVVPIPGVSALVTLISVSGIDMSEFIFLGFPPHKKGRETFFKKVTASQIPVIYYESPHRVIKNLELLKTLAPDKKIILGRELTKMFEEVVRGSVAEAIAYFDKNKDKIKGEFVIIVY